jgi:hypothetical protein
LAKVIRALEIAELLAAFAEDIEDVPDSRRQIRSILLVAEIHDVYSSYLRCYLVAQQMVADFLPSTNYPEEEIAARAIGSIRVDEFIPLTSHHADYPPSAREELGLFDAAGEDRFYRFV